MNVISRLTLDFMAKENIIIRDEKSKGEQLCNRLSLDQDDKALYCILDQQIK